MSGNTGVFMSEQGRQSKLYSASVRMVLFMRLGLALIFCTAYFGLSWLGS
jgi:hypothetical protein